MSDAPRQRDGDEVLASVRRLVADERTRRAGDEAADGASGRLVLTPQLRVAPQRSEPAPAAGAVSGSAQLSAAQPPLRVPRPAPSDAGPAPLPVEGPAVGRDGPERSEAGAERAGEAGRGRAPSPDVGPRSGSAETEVPPHAAAAPDTVPGQGQSCPPVHAAAGAGGGTGDCGAGEGAAGAVAGAVTVSEADLRALIAEVVREELRGETGERVTRNLRKLIRAEIARALSGRSPQ